MVRLNKCSEHILHLGLFSLSCEYGYESVCTQVNLTTEMLALSRDIVGFSILCDKACKESEYIISA